MKRAELTMVCYAPQPKAHLCPLDRAILLTLGDLRGYLKVRGATAAIVRRLLVAKVLISRQQIVGSLRRLQNLGYVQRKAQHTGTSAWSLK